MCVDCGARVCVHGLTDGAGNFDTRSIPALYGLSVERLCKLSATDHSSSDLDYHERQITL